MSPSTENESAAYYIGLLVAVFAEETDVDLYGAGSTTFDREDLERDLEPDACFYVQNAGRARSKPRIDLSADPPPDLVIELDITSPPLDEFPIYARTGIPEIWRHDGEKIVILKLEDGDYLEGVKSAALPSLTSEVLTSFARESLTLARGAWMLRVREWAQEHVN